MAEQNISASDCDAHPHAGRRVDRMIDEGLLDPQAPTLDEVRHLLCDLEERCFELEKQNAELQKQTGQLERYRDWYADLYDFAPLGYVTFDKDGYVQEINLTGARLLGVGREAVIGYPFNGFVSKEDEQAFLDHLRTCVGERREVTSELRLAPKDGPAITVQLHSMPIEHPADTTLCKTAITDITRRRETEEDLRELNETLEGRVAERTALAEGRAAQLRALASELTQTEQRERRRLASMLHDNLQQLLVAAKLRAGMLRRQSEDDAVRRSAQQLLELLDLSIAESRSLTIELSPPILYDRGLVAALEWLAAQFRQQRRLAVELHADEAAEPPDESTRVLLFQAARELLSNVVRHAHSQAALLTLDRQGDQRLRLVVADAGVGFDPNEVTRGFGLFGLRERVELLGGRLIVNTAPGKGTQIVVDAPRERVPVPIPA